MPRNFHKSHRGKDQDANDNKSWDDVHNNNKDDILIIYYIILYTVYSVYIDVNNTNIYESFMNSHDSMYLCSGVLNQQGDRTEWQNRCYPQMMVDKWYMLHDRWWWWRKPLKSTSPYFCVLWCYMCSCLDESIHPNTEYSPWKTGLVLGLLILASQGGQCEWGCFTPIDYGWIFVPSLQPHVWLIGSLSRS